MSHTFAYRRRENGRRLRSVLVSFSNLQRLQEQRLRPERFTVDRCKGEREAPPPSIDRPLVASCGTCWTRRPFSSLLRGCFRRTEQVELPLLLRILFSHSHCLKQSILHCGQCNMAYIALSNSIATGYKRLRSIAMSMLDQYSPVKTSLDQQQLEERAVYFGVAVGTGRQGYSSLARSLRPLPYYLFKCLSLQLHRRGFSLQCLISTVLTLSGSL